LKVFSVPIDPTGTVLNKDYGKVVVEPLEKRKATAAY